MPPAHVRFFLFVLCRTTNGRLNLPPKITDSGTAQSNRRFDNQDFYSKRQAPMLSTGRSYSIIPSITVLARIHIGLLNIHPDVSSAELRGVFCSRTPTAHCRQMGIDPAS